jgi:large subunit ribosomal protein L29
MKTNELKNKSKSELNDMLVTLLEEQFQMRMRKSVTENPKTHLFSKVRKDIARIKTVLNQAE